MDNREKLVEKLVELLESINAYAEVNLGFDEASGGELVDFLGAEEIADHLIANGVTIQQWIPVSERLPDGECLAVSMLKYQPSYKEMLVGYVAKDARYETGYCCESDDMILPNVTHWAEKHYPAEGGG